MTLGQAGMAGEGPDIFHEPTDVLVAPNGDIFVTEGHIGGDGENNDLVVKLSSDGTIITAWGGTGSGPGQFNNPHTIAMDSQGRLFVGDRSNNRIQIFDIGSYHYK